LHVVVFVVVVVVVFAAVLPMMIKALLLDVDIGIEIDLKGGVVSVVFLLDFGKLGRFVRYLDAGDAGR